MALATHRFRQVLRQLQASCDGLPDAQLLTQFVTGHDEAAFAALVRRHGPMVLGVCRRILQHVEDAEDVFQATFLVLARKAHAVVRRDTVGSWLYRVAYRTAQEARIMRARRRAKEGSVQELPHPEVAPLDVQDWRAILDDELSRLPDKYQAPLVLCDLESRSRKDAAQQLRIPEGTLSSRLAKARRMLAVRLGRRGVTLAGGALAAALAQDALSAQVTGPVVADTARVATLVLTGQLATVATPVAVLMKGALQAMFMAKFKLVGVMILVAALTLGLGSVAYHPVGAQNTGSAARPVHELEALRRENALLKLNLEVVLEKVRAQAAELQTLKQNTNNSQPIFRDPLYLSVFSTIANERNFVTQVPPAAPTAEDLLRKVREAQTDAARAKAVDELEQAVLRLRQDLKPKNTNDPGKQ
jgi:RNA polymerase sigma factor (sigma-70 family)